MNEKLHSEKFRRTWTRRSYFKIVTISLASAAGSLFLYKTGHKFFAGTLTVLGFGNAYLSWKNSARVIMRFNKDAVIITGCDSGLGYSLALHCRHSNAFVIAGVLQPEGIGAQDLIKNGINVIPLDITKNQSITEFGNKIRDLVVNENLVIRALINNAGVMIFGEFEWQTDDQVRTQIEVNVLGTMRITKELMPIIRSMKSRIIVVTSHCSRHALPGIATYAATKAALDGWATALRVELSKYGINVVCFVPGSFTRESNLLARQSEYFTAMEYAMTNEAEHFYGNYFKRYREYLSAISKERVPKKLENPQLYEAFDGALMDLNPRAIYKCEPWRYTLYYFLFGITSFKIRDCLVERFMMMPKWNNANGNEN